jgi:hypothetical protein
MRVSARIRAGELAIQSRQDAAPHAAAATVSFDDGKVTPEAMTTAVTNAGFPAYVQVNRA